MSKKVSFSFIGAIGFMLFALFFGAGNLIFPALLGQSAGENLWSANFGFIITGVGLPLLGILAFGYSGKEDLQSLASRAHPLFGLVFTVILYLAIGPLFAIPRTGSVSYEIALKPYIGENSGFLPLFIFTAVFFGITAFFSLNPAKIVDIVGKILTPVLLIFILFLIAVSVLNPMGDFQAPIKGYQEHAFYKGFQEGYLTMDTLASFVFGIIVINAVRENGAATKKEIMLLTSKAGFIAAGLLAVIYTSLTYIGASSVPVTGLLDNGGIVLTEVFRHYFGSAGGILLGIIVIAACLTTSIGLITACASYFQQLLPGISYKSLVVILSGFSLIMANFGLNQLIAISVPILTAIYPLAIVLIVLTFLHDVFKGRREVYLGAFLLTFIVSLIDGLSAAGVNLTWLKDILGAFLPLFKEGLGWIIPAIAGALIGLAVSAVRKPKALS